jgi:hypothetical protein
MRALGRIIAGMSTDEATTVEDTDLWCPDCGALLVRAFGWCSECVADRFALHDTANAEVENR